MNERLKELRKQLGLTLEEFGRKVGVTRSAVGRIEKGERTITDQMFISICREFNVNEEWLRTGEGDMFIELDPEDELMIWAGTVLKDKPESFRRRFVRMLSKMTDEEWGWVESKLLELYEGIEKATDE